MPFPDLSPPLRAALDARGYSLVLAEHHYDLEAELLRHMVETHTDPTADLSDLAAQIRAARRTAIEAALQDRLHRRHGAGVDGERAITGSLDPLGPIAAGQTQDPEAGAKALFGVWPVAEDDVDQDPGGRTDAGGPVAQPRVGEGVEDLQAFDARAFSRSLVGLED